MRLTDTSPGTALAVVFLLAIFGLMGALIGQSATKYEYSIEEDLLSLKDKADKESYTTGAFFLFIGGFSSGTITDRYYIAYAGTRTRGYSLTRFPLDETRIFQDTERPFVRTFFERSDFLFRQEFGVVRYELHVPPGTIIQEYKLDMEGE